MKKIDHTPKYSVIHRDLYTSGKRSDVTLVVQGVKFTVHRLILSSQSEFFDKLFYDNQFQEGSQDEIPIEAPIEAFKTILEYLYMKCLDLKTKSLEEILEILELSRRFGLIDLEVSLIDEIDGMVGVGNLNLVKATAEIMESEKLHEKFWEVLNKNVEKYFDVERIEAMDEDEIYDILSNERLKLINIKKFYVVSKWIKSHPQCKDEMKQKLLKVVDLSRLSNNQLVKIVRPTKLYDSDYLFDILTERKVDVPEEVTETPKVNSNLQVVDGRFPQNLFSDSEYTIAELINGQFQITVNVTGSKCFNFLEFNVGDDSPVYFNVKLTYLDNSGKQFNRNSNGLNRVYFKSEKYTQIQIIGVEKCNSFKINQTFGNQYCNVGGYLVPKENVITVQRSMIVGRPNDQLLLGKFEDKDLETTFTEIPAKGIEIRFKEPFYLNNFRLRLWDFDGRKQSFNIHSIQVDNTLAPLNSFENAKGWQTWKQDDLCRGFKIVPTTNQKTLRIAYFSATHCF